MKSGKGNRGLILKLLFHIFTMKRESEIDTTLFSVSDFEIRALSYDSVL